MQRISRYYPGCDGTKLAVDLYLPELAPDQKIPAVFHMGNDPRRMRYDTMAPFITRLVEEGYAVVLPEPRGVGVSFGCNEGFFNRTDGHDAAVLIDTIAAEDWCSGEVGMFGGSNLGNIQELAATWQPKALKCIIPCDCNANGYYQNYPNGASALPMPGNFAPPPGFTPVPPVPVDDDPEGIQSAKALEEHKGNGLFLAQYMPNMHRDTVHPRLGYATNTDIPVWSHMDKLRYSDLNIYQNAAWYDPGCTGSLISYKSWGGTPFKPQADEKCDACGLCARECPVDAIDPQNPAGTDADKCITCMRCISVCPQKARRCDPQLMAERGEKMIPVLGGHKENYLFI